MEIPTLYIILAGLFATMLTAVLMSKHTTAEDKAAATLSIIALVLLCILI